VFEVAIIAGAWAQFWTILGVFNSLIIHKVEKLKNFYAISLELPTDQKKNTRESQK